jgi:hypothetical protein
VTHGPFYELINFADHEGVIGPKTSAKLAGDFAAFAEKSKAFAESLSVEDRDGWNELYELWRRAFEVAAHRGAVLFC